MFLVCTNLNRIECMATNIGTSFTSGWVQGVQTVSGTFVKNATAISWTRGNDGIPLNWEVEDSGGTPSEDYTAHDATWMTVSHMRRVPNPLDIKKYEAGGAASSWTYHDGIVLKAVLDTYNAYNGPSLNLASFASYADTYFAKMIQTNGTIINNQYVATELDDKEVGVALSLNYELTNEAKYKTCLDMIYSGYSGISVNADGVYWHKVAYPRQGWVDGLYMAQPLRAEYASKYLTGIQQLAVFDDVCNQIITMTNRTYDSGTGLYRHAYDASALESETPVSWVDPNSLSGMQSYCIWGRALGWAMMAIVDTLDYLPTRHAGRTTLINILSGLCTNLKTYADPTTGVWRNLPTEGPITQFSSGNSNDFEASSSCMFAYAWLKGVRMGYLPASEKSYALSVYNAVRSAFITESGSDLSINSICPSSNPGVGCSTREQVLELYCSKTYVSNNSHGLAPFIWAAIEYEQLAD